MPPVFWTVILPFVLVAWWCFIMWMVAHLCGWSALARHYRRTEPFGGPRHRFRSGKIGSGNYNGCLTLGASSDGLALAVFLPFRIAHPPLFIPWSELTPRIKHSWLFGESLEFEVADCPGVKLRFPKLLAEELAADANLAWDRSEPT